VPSCLSPSAFRLPPSCLCPFTSLNYSVHVTHGAAKPRGQLTLWRRALLIILDLHPPWWALGKSWVILALLLIVLGVLLSLGHTVSGAAGFVWSMDARGQWLWNTPSQADQTRLEFDATFDRTTGPAWEECSVSARRYEAGPAAVPSATLESLRRQGWQRLIDLELEKPVPARTALCALVMLRDAPPPATGAVRTRGGWIMQYFRRKSGPMIWARRAALTLAVLLLGAAALVGKLRRLLRHGYTDRLALAAKQICPRCLSPRRAPDRHMPRVRPGRPARRRAQPARARRPLKRTKHSRLSAQTVTSGQQLRAPAKNIFCPANPAKRHHSAPTQRAQTRPFAPL
jgi:hypothetical protein